MNHEHVHRFLEPSTPEETQAMLLILSTAIHEALEVLPDTEENQFGLALLRSGPILALYEKEKDHLTLDEFLRNLFPEQEEKNPAVK